MKNIKSLILAALALFAIPSIAHAACTTAICKTDGALTINSGGTVTALSGSTVALSGTNTMDGTFKFNSASGTSVTALRFASDTVASGQTAKTTTLAGVTASSKCVATGNEVPTNAVYIKSAAPGTDQVVVTTSGDPGASNLDFTVVCWN